MHSDYASALASLMRLILWTSIAFLQQIWCFFFTGFTQMPLLWLGKWGFTFDWDLSSVGIGMILPNQINFSILLGGIIAQLIIIPWIQTHHECEFNYIGDKECWFYKAETPSYASSYIRERAYYFYPGVAMVVVDGFYSIFKLVFLLVQGYMKKEDAVAVVENTDVDNAQRAREAKLREIFLKDAFPGWFLVGGYGCSAALTMALVGSVFHVKWYEVLLAVCLTPIFSVGIIVGVGMTDWDVSASFGKLMMIPFGAMSGGQGSLIPPLAACMMTVSGCGAAAGLMQDFKTGYLLGASPKTMFIAQMIGAFTGCFAAPAMFEIFNNAYLIPGPPEQAIPGIFGTSYRVLAGVFTSGGLSSLPDNCGYFIIAAAIVALLLNALSDLLPAKAAQFMPNAMAVSIGLMMGTGVGINFSLGGLAVAIWRLSNSEKAEKFYIVVACGCLAGGAIGQMGVIALQASGVPSLAWPTYPTNWVPA